MSSNIRKFGAVGFFVLILVNSTVAQICNIHCDEYDPENAVDTRVAVTAEIYGRVIQLIISDGDNMGFADISNGNPNDEVWLDRSWNGGFDWEGKLGDTFIPEGSSDFHFGSDKISHIFCDGNYYGSWRTLMYNVDNPSAHGIGALRACGKAGDRDEISCTGWARSSIGAETHVDAAATAMMQLYDGKLWPTTGWWNAANCLTAMIDYFKVTGSRAYDYVIDEVFVRNVNEHDGNFTNEYIDDTLWWGLAWVGAYDITGERRYLDMAQIDADYSYAYKDDVCGGGLWWTTRRDYKNAIPNELFIKLAAALHNRIDGDTKYLDQAVEVYNWFKNSGMINSDNLINDGLTEDCQNNGQVTWSYNQGVILGGLVELFRGTGDETYLDDARRIAEAVLSSPDLVIDGVLYEYGCENGGGDCGGDGPSFKGVFVRNLGELDRELSERPYKDWLEVQANSNWENNRNTLNQFDVHWHGPFGKANGATHHSGFECFTAAA